MDILYSEMNRYSRNGYGPDIWPFRQSVSERGGGGKVRPLGYLDTIFLDLTIGKRVKIGRNFRFQLKIFDFFCLKNRNYDLF